MIYINDNHKRLYTEGEKDLMFFLMRLGILEIRLRDSKTFTVKGTRLMLFGSETILCNNHIFGTPIRPRSIQPNLITSAHTLMQNWSWSHSWWP